MQPSNSKLNNKAQGLARAKMLIKSHLYWLNGYPVIVNNKVYWQCPFSNMQTEKFQISAKMVSKAQRTIFELLKDFPLALPIIVGDINIWSNHCQEYLEYYKWLVKNPDQFSSASLFERNKSYFSKFEKFLPVPNCQHLVNSLSWLYYIERKPLIKSLKFIAKYQNKLSTSKLPNKQLLHLCHLYNHDGYKTETLINLVLSSADINIRTKVRDDYLKDYLNCKIAKSSKKLNIRKPTLAEASSAETIINLLGCVIGLKETKRKIALSIINSFDLYPLLKQWHNWWCKVNSLCEKIENIIRYGEKYKARDLLVLQKKLKNLQKIRPDDFDLSYIVAAIKRFSEHKSLSQSLVKLFISLPTHVVPKKLKYPKKIDFLTYFHTIFVYGAIKPLGLSNYLLHFAKYIKFNQQCHKNSPWYKLEVYYWGAIESEIFDQLHHKDYARFFNIITQIQHQANISPHEIEQVITIIAAQLSDERVISLVLYLLDKKVLDDMSDVVIKISIYYDLDNDHVVKLIKIWNKFNQEYTDADTLDVMFKTFVRINADDLFQRLLFSGHANQLRKDCYQIRNIQKLAGLSFIPEIHNVTPKSALWIEPYPAFFSKQLKQYNSICPGAETKVNKIFLSHWWTKEMLLTQIVKVEDQLQKLKCGPRDKLSLRLDNLQSKLNNHKDITVSERQKIHSKIDTQITLEQYKNWQQRLHVVFTKIWSDFFGLTKAHIPEWFFDSDVVYKLMPIIDFCNKDQQLAIKVIQNRCFSQDWSFINEDKNRSFIHKLTQSGINSQIWIDGIGHKTFQTENAQTITLRVSKDPLDTLNMGAYFKTCLSPTSFNYFSVFANIADINKQVIYATNAQNKVIGRVLVGLTDSGGLMVYHRYYHNAQDDFNKSAMAYIEDWAAQAGLTLTQKGTVSTLVASNWYDDCAINVDNAIECYKQDSEFRKSLLTTDTGEFMILFQQSLLPLKINAITFSLLLNLPELPKNKSLFPVLIDIAQKLNHLELTDKINLYKLSHQMDASNYYNYFRKIVNNYQRQLLKTNKWFDIDVALLMADNHPSDALNLVKKFARIESKNWQENLSYGSYKVAVKALNNLGRQQQAKRIELFYQNSN
ncbi:MAG: hypothetical protein JKY19_05025 [Alcanivoracaceae bacterium]|nr:hypothetical protein [Alcanivoracaceae bacterium]